MNPVRAIRTIRGHGWLAVGSATLFLAVALLTPETNVGVESASGASPSYLGNRDAIGVLLLSTSLTSAALLWFLAVLRAGLRTAEGGAGMFSALAITSGLLVVAFTALGGALRVAAGLGVSVAADAAQWAGSILLAEAANNTMVELSTVWRGSLLAAVAIVTVRYGGLPRWFGWLSAVLAVGSFVGVLSFIKSSVSDTATMAGFGSFIAFHFWVLLAGVVLAVRSASETGVDPRPAAVRATSAQAMGS